MQLALSLVFTGDFDFEGLTSSHDANAVSESKEDSEERRRFGARVCISMSEAKSSWKRVPSRLHFHSFHLYLVGCSWCHLPTIWGFSEGSVYVNSRSMVSSSELSLYVTLVNF